MSEAGSRRQPGSFVNVLPVPHPVQDDILSEHVVSDAVNAHAQPPPTDAFPLEPLDVGRWAEGLGLETPQGGHDPFLIPERQLFEIPQKARGELDRESSGHASACARADKMLR